MSRETPFSQDRVHAMDNMMIFIISHVISDYDVIKLTKTEKVSMAEYNRPFAAGVT